MRERVMAPFSRTATASSRPPHRLSLATVSGSAADPIPPTTAFRGEAPALVTLRAKRLRRPTCQRGLLFWALATAVSVALNLVSLLPQDGGDAATCQVLPAEQMDLAQDIPVNSIRPLFKDSVINLDHGDPTMFESFWQRVGDRGTVVIPGWQRMSYFSDPNNDCWFMEQEFAAEVRRLHRLVGNAVTDDRYIVVGTGSTQLFQAALYALSPSNGTKPMSVVSAVPYYSSYPAVTDYLKSGLFQWAGDANTYKGDEYIELVCSPNNPDGFIRTNVLSSATGKAIHDLAYYWPQYTPITSKADHDLMLFTVSKSTGHAGTRLGWALVKDRSVAKRMTKFIELNTIGVSKDSQVRAAKILSVISDGYELADSGITDRLFDYGRLLMAGRWERLREAVRKAGIFSLPEFPSDTCNFAGEWAGTYPAFAWLKCEKMGVEDCEAFLRSHKIITRGGKHFGVEATFVRVSMLDRDETFYLFTERLSSIS